MMVSAEVQFYSRLTSRALGWDRLRSSILMAHSTSGTAVAVRPQAAHRLTLENAGLCPAACARAPGGMVVQRFRERRMRRNQTNIQSPAAFLQTSLILPNIYSVTTRFVIIDRAIRPLSGLLAAAPLPGNAQERPGISLGASWCTRRERVSRKEVETLFDRSYQAPRAGAGR